MTTTADAPGQVVPSGHITATIDDISVVVPKGTLIIRAAEQIGIEIPRFCDHPLLDPVAACRMCLIEIEGMPKPQPACAIPLTDGMVVHTQLTSVVADVAQRGVMEFLLINHPLDCPVCDKGGECPLQNQSMTAGRSTSRFDGRKRTFPKPINVSAQVLLDRERCVSCARCTRFADEIAGDAFIGLLERGAKQQVGTASDQPFDSYFSGNTVQICPVGALTSAGYRFRSRPFDLVSTPTACEHCAAGCAMRTDARHGTVMRRLAGDDPAVNEEWNCDKGRFAFPYLNQDRLKTPLLRDESGELVPASWPAAIAAAAAGLAPTRGHSATLTGGRLCREDAYAYAKFTRVALGSDDLDFRARPASTEEHDFLASVVAGAGIGADYAALDTAPVVVLVGLEPEEESPIIFLRLRKAVAKGTTKVVAIAPWRSPGFAKTSATVIPTIPGDEPLALAALTDPARSDGIAELLSTPGAVILAGERLATVNGGLTAAVALARQTGAELAWVPRRAGERGALEAGALAGVLPGGRPLADAGARAEVAAAWGLAADGLPASPGRDLAAILAVLAEQRHTVADRAAAELAAADEDGPTPGGSAEDGGEGVEREVPRLPIESLVLAGLEAGDLTDPVGFLAGVETADFVLQLTAHLNDVSAAADVVLPVKVDTERAGSYLDWEGRVRTFPRVFRDVVGFTDGEVLAMVARELGSPIGTGDTVAFAREAAALGEWNEDRPAFLGREPEPVTVSAGEAVLATWRHLLDLGALQAGEPYLEATRRPVVARISPELADSLAVTDGDEITVATPAGSITLPVRLTPMPDHTVWLPTNSQGSQVHQALRVTAGATVRVSAGGAQ